MYLIFGTSNYGKTDELPGLCYVATEFFHVYYVPVIPLRSLLIVEGTDEKQFKKIDMSGKSVMLTYLRGMAGVGALICTVIFVATCFHLFNWHKDKALADNKWYFLAAGIVGFVVLVLSYLWMKPHPVRALELANILGIPMDKVVDLYVDDPRVEMMMNEPQDTAAQVDDFQPPGQSK